jgi:hypothetical protein
VLVLQVVALQAVAEAHVKPPAHCPGVPGVHVPELLHDPAGVISAFPCESTVHDAVPQPAPVLATQTPVAAEHVAHPEHAFPVFCQVPLASQVCGWEPLHRFCPFVHSPVQPALVLHAYKQVCAVVTLQVPALHWPAA